MIKKIQNNLLSQPETKQNILAFSLIGIFALFLLRGAFHGISTPDESFYLTIPYRIILGDSLLIDEWHASQLSSFILYLPMKLFITLTGGTDGIVLFFRCLFVLCQTLVAVFTYAKIKKYGTFPAIISALLFLTYVTEQVHMLDYYTMTLMGFQVSGLLLLTDEKLTRPKLIFIGIVFAFTVTAQPFNSAVYFIYCGFVLFFLFFRKKKDFSAFTKRILDYKAWLYITAGIVISAIIFMIFMLSQASLSEIIANIGNLFSGQDHNLPFSQEADSDMFSYKTIIVTLFSFAPVSFCISLLTVILVICDRKRREHKNFWLYVCLTVMAVYTVALVLSTFKNPSAALFRPYPLFIMTLPVLLIKKELNRELFSVWLMGIFYTLFLGIISQALDYVGAIGFVLSNTALMPAIKELSDEIKAENKINKKIKNKKSSLSLTAFITTAAVCCLVILTGGVAEFIDDVTALSLGRTFEKSEVTVSSGPLKGIKTSKTKLIEYEKISEDIDTIKENTDGKVLVAGLIPWTYFCFDTPPATFTTWYIGNELYMFESYYEDEEHRPQCIYIPDTSFYWGGNYKNTAISHTRYFKNMFSGSTRNGEIGTIFYVDKMR